METDKNTKEPRRPTPERAEDRQPSGGAIEDHGAEIKRIIISGVDQRRLAEMVPSSSLMPGATILSCIAAAARLNPDKDALIFLPNAEPGSAAERVSYAALMRRIVGAANLFRNLADGRTPVVGFLATTTPDMLVGYWAAVTAGKAVVINPAVETAQLVGILQASQVDILVVDANGHASGAWHRIDAILAQTPGIRTVLRLDGSDTLQRTAAGLPVDQLTFEPDDHPDRIIAIMPTGGTTGAPKLVQMTACGQLINAWCFGAMSASGADDVTAMGMPNFHVGGLVALALRTVIYGQTLVILGPTGFRDPGFIQHFWQLARIYRFTNAVAVPTTAIALLGQGASHDHAITCFACGGSAVPMELYRTFLQQTGIHLRETWGLSEMQGPSTLQYGGASPPRAGAVGVAYPFHRVAAATVVPGQPVELLPPGTSGTLLLSGPTLTPGYLDPAFDDELFVIDTDGRRWANSGDLGEVDADGFVWVHGRVKDLIIRGGHNIEPSVIEEAAERHTAVLLAAAVAMPDLLKGELPILYVQLKPGAAVTAALLLEHCRAAISERAAVPVDVIVLEAMPVTAVGKIAKPALREDATRRVAERTARALLGDECALIVTCTMGKGRPVVTVCCDRPDLEDLNAAFLATFGGFAFSARLEALSTIDRALP